MSWPTVFRVVWLSGGLTAANEPGPDVEIQVGLGGPTLQKLQIASFPSLYAALRDVKLTVVGVSFLTHVDEGRGLRKPEFRGWREK